MTTYTHMRRNVLANRAWQFAQLATYDDDVTTCSILGNQFDSTCTAVLVSKRMHARHTYLRVSNSSTTLSGNNVNITRLRARTSSSALWRARVN